VLTGVTDRRRCSRAPRAVGPPYLSSDLRGLARAHPEVAVRGTRDARCRRPSAVRTVTWWSRAPVTTPCVPRQR
jgi:hypothetical protein